MNCCDNAVNMAKRKKNISAVKCPFHTKIASLCRLPIDIFAFFYIYIVGKKLADRETTMAGVARGSGFGQLVAFGQAIQTSRSKAV